jgi:hypothetical protein
MRLFSKISTRIPRGIAIMTMGFAGIFGMRTPPDPEVVAQTAPRPQAAGAAGDAFCRDERRQDGSTPDEKIAPGQRGG